jgi:hypothetical protein
MSGDARISTGLPGHPKTMKLIRRLGAGAAWNLVCLFLWAASNRSDGDFTGMSDEDLELAAHWGGDEGVFVAVLADIRFLDGEEGAYCVHDWAEHNPWAAGAISRSYKARWNAAKRHHGEKEADRLVPQYAAARNADSNASSNAASTRVAMLDQKPSNAPSPSPLPSPLPKKQKTEQASPNGSRLATDWQLPDDWREWAEAERPGILVSEEAAKFADYWHSLPGAKARKTDWFKTWCNWIRNSRAVGNARASPSAAPSRRLQTLQSLEDLKNGLDNPRDSDRLSETFLLGPGEGAGWGRNEGNGDGMG